MLHTDNKLLSFKTIDSTVGLKYLNENEELYLKILNNFLLRYQDIEFLNLDEVLLMNTLHSIKGLSATLGMMDLAKACIQAENSNKEKSALLEFSSKLEEVMDELKHLFNVNKEKMPSTILIIEDNRENIDELIEILEEYDILIALNRYEALEIFDQEKINIVLLNSKLNHSSGREIFDFLKQYTNIGDMPNIFIDIPFQAEKLIEEIEEKLKISENTSIKYL